MRKLTRKNKVWKDEKAHSKIYTLEIKVCWVEKVHSQNLKKQIPKLKCVWMNAEMRKYTQKPTLKIKVCRFEKVYS